MSISTAKHIAEKTADVSYDVHPLIEERWSPRTFSSKQLESDALNILLEAVRWAASSRNEQPWRLIYAFSGTKPYENIFECLSESNRKWAGKAPVLMLAAYKENFSSGKENFHALHDLGLSLGNMTLQAQSMGIALHHMAGVDWQKAQKIFQVPDGYHIATAIAVGYYGGNPEKLEKSLQQSEFSERQRMPQAHFAGEGIWPEEDAG